MAETESGREQAYQLIVEKRDQLLRERVNIRMQRVALATRDRAIDRDLADCVAAARVFGYPLELPKDEGDSEQNPLFSTAILTGKTLAGSGLLFHGPHHGATPQLPAAESKEAAAPAMPKIRDIVLDRLQAAGYGGTKALPIRKYIEDTYHQDIHEKTVGMTLYRLSNDGKAHRRGRIWFFGPERAGTENPGGGSPGSVTEPETW